MSSTSNFPSSHALQSGRPTCNLLKSCKPVFTPFSLESSTCLPLLDYSHQRKPLASCISSLKSPSPDTLSFVHFSSWQILKSLICVLYLFYGHCVSSLVHCLPSPVPEAVLAMVTPAFVSQIGSHFSKHNPIWPRRSFRLVDRSYLVDNIFLPRNL